MSKRVKILFSVFGIQQGDADFQTLDSYSRQKSKKRQLGVLFAQGCSCLPMDLFSERDTTSSEIHNVESLRWQDQILESPEEGMEAEPTTPNYLFKATSGSTISLGG